MSQQHSQNEPDITPLPSKQTHAPTRHLLRVHSRRLPGRDSVHVMSPRGTCITKLSCISIASHDATSRSMPVSCFFQDIAAPHGTPRFNTLASCCSATSGHAFATFCTFAVVFTPEASGSDVANDAGGGVASTEGAAAANGAASLQSSAMTAFIAAAASGLMSGRRPGICQWGVPWGVTGGGTRALGETQNTKRRVTGIQRAMW